MVPALCPSRRLSSSTHRLVELRPPQHRRLSCCAIPPQHDAAQSHTSSHSTPLDEPSSHPSTSASRRQLLGSMAMTPLGLCAQPAQALKTVELKDGSQVEVFEHGMSLSIVALRGSVPSQWVMDYRSTLGKYSGFGLGQRQQIKDIFQELGLPSEKQSAGAADVASLGDSWLSTAIQRRLVQPIPNAEYSRWWRSLGPRWHQLLRRDENGMPSRTGQIYGAPYRWGATVVAYRRDRVGRGGGRPIRDWDDLLQPQLKGRVAFLDSSRQLVAIALKSLGMSANTGAAELMHPRQGPQHQAPQRGVGGRGAEAAGTSAAAEAEAEAGTQLPAAALRRRVQELRAQALLFSNRDHIRALSAGDAWVAVGSSQDLISVSERMSNLQVVAPESGCLLHADVWVVPSGAKGGNRGIGPSPLLPSWLEFGVAPARALQHSNLKSGLAPLTLPEPALPSGPAHLGGRPQPQPQPQPQLQPELQHAVEDELVVAHKSGFLPGRTVLQRSEFLMPLDAATSELYNDILRDR